MSLIRKLAGQTAIYGASSIFSRLLNYVILTPYLTRWFNPESYGIISVLFTYAAILMVFYTHRMETAFFRFGTREDGIDLSFSTAAWSVIGTTFCFSGFILLLLGPISQWTHYEQYPEYIIWVTSIIIFDALVAIPFARLRLENRPIRFAIAKTLGILINIACIFFLIKGLPALAENGVSWAQDIYREADRISYVFVSNLVASGFVFLLLFPNYLKIKLRFNGMLWRKMLWYASPLIIVSMAAVLNQNVAFLLLENIGSGNIDDNRSLSGIYSAAAKVAVLMSLFTQAFNYAAEPFFFSNVAHKDSKEVYAQVGQLFALVGCIVFLCILFYLDILQFFIGADLRTGFEIVPILLMANLWLGLYYNFAIWFKLSDRTRFGAYISIGGAIITFIINIWLIPSYGIFGPAWAMLACYFFMAMASYLTGQKYYPIGYPIGRIFLYIFGAVIFYLASLMIRPMIGPQLYIILSVNTILLIIYLGIVYMVDGKSILKIIK